MKSIRRKAIALAVAGLLLGTACSAGNGSAGAEGKTLNMAFPSVISSIDVGKGDAIAVLVETAGVLETLVTVDYDLNLQPVLATSWERTGDTTWQFTLRDDVTFHDGTKLDAEAVKWCLDNSLANNTSLPALAPITSITVVDPQTVEFETEYATGELPQALTNVATAIYAKSSINDAGEFETIVGTGYYKQDSFDVASGRYEASVYDGYWHEVDTNIERRTVIGISDANTRSLAVQNGEIDLTLDAPFADFRGLENADGITAQVVNSPRTYFISYNLKKPALQDEKVRKALIYAVDKTELVNDALLGVGAVPDGIFPSDVPWNNTDVDNYDFDPELAKSMLAEAGYTDTDGDGYVDKDGEKLTINILAYTLRPGFALIAQAMQGYFENIGVNTTVDVLELSAGTERIENGDFDLNLSSGAVNYIPSPCYYLNANYKTGSTTAKNIDYSNADLDALISQCNDEIDIDKKTELSKQAQALAQEDAAIYTVADYATVFVYSDKLQNIDFHPASHYFIVPENMSIA